MYKDLLPVIVILCWMALGVFIFLYGVMSLIRGKAVVVIRGNCFLVAPPHSPVGELSLE
jgi:hypothetical protein